VNWAQAVSLPSGILTPVPPLQKRGEQCAVVLCGGCKENSELGTSCKLATAGEMPDGKIVHINTVDKGNYNGSGMTEREYINAQRIQKDAPNSKVITIGKGDVPGDLTIEKPKDGCDN